jgi:hypothetical protein
MKHILVLNLTPENFCNLHSINIFRMLKRFLPLFSLLIVFKITPSFSQAVYQPNFGLKSHETLDLKKIVTEKDQTIIYLTIENRIQGGNFCAGKNIFIIYPDGKRSRLKSSSGIPVCPDTYKFKTIGEKLDFTLSFSGLKKDTKWIDLVEECDANCFSIYGITVDSVMNKKIDETYFKAKNATPTEGMKYFSDLLNETDKLNLGSEGMLYINIIKLAREAGNEVQAKEWYQKFQLSDAPRLPQYLKYLNDQSVKY